jgi:hypothetical protein
MKYFLKNFFKAERDMSAFSKAQALTSPAYISTTGRSWEDTGMVYYLLDTLKITYQGSAGLITIEKLSIDNVVEILESIYSVAYIGLAPDCVAEVQASINISVCGISWDKRGNKYRVKAMPDAAVLRTLDNRCIQSQALFQHAALQVDDGISPLEGRLHQCGALKYSGISFGQFIQKLKAANEAIDRSFVKKSPISADNFSTIYSATEEEFIVKSINALNSI